MSIWFVLTIFGKVAVAVGPLPAPAGPDVALSACWEYAREQEAKLDEAHANPAIQKPVLDGRTVRREDIIADCRVQDARPPLEDFQ